MQFGFRLYARSKFGYGWGKDNMVNRLLCMIGLHDWEYKIDSIIYQIVYPHRVCQKCGITKGGWGIWR